MEKSQSTCKNLPVTIPFGIYVHIPFCVHKCSYCDFYSFTQYGRNDFERLEAQLVNEVRQMAAYIKERQGNLSPVTSVFFGGGTPSLMPTSSIQKICDTLAEEFPFAKEVEITLEANPETVDARFAASLFATPVNRVSLGAQSFQAKHLKSLERLGSAESIVSAVGFLKEAGFTNFNLDLITGIPGQSEEEFLEDIEKAVSLGPTHLSFYTLTLKSKHPLATQLPSEDKAADLYEAGIRRLQILGFDQYEISNFARPGLGCRHNLLYWSGGDFLGIGPSASSRFFWERVFHHRKQKAHFETYLELNEFRSLPFETTTKAQTVLEASFLELRTNDGVDLDQFQARYGYDFRKAKKYELFAKNALIQEKDNRLVLSHRGRLLADSVTEQLVDWI